MRSGKSLVIVGLTLVLIVLIVIMRPALLSDQPVPEIIPARHTPSDSLSPKDTPKPSLNSLPSLTSPVLWENEGYLSLIQAYLHVNDTTAASKIWEQARDSADLEPLALYELAQAFVAQGKISTAADILSTILEKHPDNVQSLLLLGLLTATVDPAAAQDFLDKAAEIDQEVASQVAPLQQAVRSSQFVEDQAYQLVMSGRALASLGYWDLASMAFRRAIQHDPYYAEAWAFLGEAHQHLGQDGSAEIQHALTLNPQSFTAQTLSALYWQRQERYDLALVFLYTAASLEPDNPIIQIEIGRTLALIGDLPSALKHYQQATELDPYDAVAWCQLAEFSLQHEIQISEIAIPAARQAVLLQPDNPEALDLLGQAYFLLKDIHTAERFFQRALQSDAQYAPAHLHLGILNLYRGMKTEARNHLNLVLSLDPDSAAAEQARRLLHLYFP
ncbi:MAG: tetratricopeptide repeat protein [Chloroflexota bacterium]